MIIEDCPQCVATKGEPVTIVASVRFKTVLSVVLAAALAILLAVASQASAANLLVIPGEETGYNENDANDYHIISLGATSHVDWNAPLQTRINGILAQKSRPILAHPGDDDFPIDVILSLSGVYGMEVYHSTQDWSLKWDQALTAGRKIRGFGVDDGHNSLKYGGTAFVVAKAASLTQTSILAALDAGSFYASQGPTFTDLGVTSGGRIFARTSTASTFNFIADGRVIQSKSSVTYSELNVRSLNGYRYVRVEAVRASDGKKATSQPFYIGNRGSIQNPYAAAGSWYKGNTHFHTLASDGIQSPADNMDWYASQGYSWLSAGDHNVITTDFARPTVANVAATPATITPNADGIADTATFSYTTYEPTTNRVYIYDSAGTLIRYLTGWLALGAGAQTAVWDGKYTDANGASVTAPSGKYTLIARVKDAVGNIGEAQATVAIDGTLATAAVSPTTFSPNADGAKDTTMLSYTLERDASVSVEVRNALGTAVRSLSSATFQATGAYSVVWDGRDNAGLVVADGKYTLLITASGALGTTQVARTVTLDNLQPVVSAAAVGPDPLVLPGTATIGFATTEAGSATVYVINAAGTTIRTLASTTVVTGANTMSWDGKDSAGVQAPGGDYQIRLYVKDLASNKATVYPVYLTIHVASTVASAAVSPTQFSPNGDGAKDTTTLTYGLETSATVSVDVANAGGAVVRSLRPATAQSLGSYAVIWDGRDNAGLVAADGNYTLLITASGVSGTTQVARTVTLDNLQPVVSEAAVGPDPLLLPGTATIGFATTEAGSATVYVINAAGATIRTLTSTTVKAGANTMTWDGMDTAGVQAPAGAYQIRLYVKDLASNKATVYPVRLTLNVSP